MADPAPFMQAWGLAGAPCILAATRENTVFRVTLPDGDAALRLRRPGYRSAAELRAELDWMAALADGGLHVPRPIPALSGALCVTQDGLTADLVRWIDGMPMGENGRLSDMSDPAAAYYALGAETARLHSVSDAWTPTKGFTRPAWDVDGLLGPAPVWGRFWENPALNTEDRALINRARAQAADHLTTLADHLDYGLIHADLTPENVILTDAAPALIDFDDGGWGFRAFDLATIANRARRAGQGEQLIPALIAGYQSQRAFDPQHLLLFQLLRAFTYLGWIVPRLHEPGAEARADRFVAEATGLATDYLTQRGS